MRGWMLIGAMLLAGTASAGDAVRIVAAVDTRGGPGAYYAAGAKLLAGASVKITGNNGGWVQAEFAPKQTAWIPAYALQPAQEAARPGELLRAMSKGMLRSLSSLFSSTPREPLISRANASLGIRGFSKAYAAHHGLKAAADLDPTLWENPPFDADGYRAFVSTRFAGRDWAALKARMPLATPAPLPDTDSDKLGAALANFVAREDGLIRNPALEAYLSEIAQLVAESSHAYELPMHVFVLRSAEPKGFVSPNGIVFISAGALRKMQSEAEFAFFVGHEIAHVAFGHGLRKLDRDEARAHENDSFAEMDHELGWDTRTGDRYVRTAEELSDLADQVHEYFQSEGNDADELEADYWGLIYAARAGYVPEAAEALLLRIVAADAKGGSGLLWNGVSRDKRLEGIRRGYAAIKLDRSGLRSFDAEFRAKLAPKRAP